MGLMTTFIAITAARAAAAGLGTGLFGFEYKLSEQIGHTGQYNDRNNDFVHHKPNPKLIRYTKKANK